MSKSDRLGKKARAAFMMSEAKRHEFYAASEVNDLPAAEKARTESLAALESHFDLYRECHVAVEEEKAQQ